MSPHSNLGRTKLVNKIFKMSLSIDIFTEYDYGHFCIV